MKRFAAFFGLVGLGGGWALVSPASLDSPTFDLVSVQDSGTYFVYSYSMSNPATSTEAIGPFVLSISASSGTPSPLAATGNFYDYSNLTHAPGNAAPRAEVGPMTPTGWTALLQRTATVRWYPTVAGLQHLDSIAPDSTITGFGLRSSYLPGISSVLAEPTWQACCSVMNPVTQQNPIPDTFAVSASAVAPKYMPSEVELDLLQSQLTAICGSLFWLDNSSLCTEFGDLLDEAEVDETNGSHYGAASVLGHLSSRVSTEQAEFESSGYWLFSLNVEQARENLLAAAAASADQWHFVEGEHQGPRRVGRR